MDAIGPSVCWERSNLVIEQAQQFNVGRPNNAVNGSELIFVERQSTQIRTYRQQMIVNCSDLISKQVEGVESPRQVRGNPCQVAIVSPNLAKAGGPNLVGKCFFAKSVVPVTYRPNHCWVVLVLEDSQ